MTKAQSARYWRDWGRVRKMLVEMGDFSKEDADAERKEIHLRALGSAKSSKDLTNRDLDKIYRAFAAYLVIETGPQAPATGPQDECKRLLWAISRTGCPAEYLAAIAADQFGTRDWQALPEEKLRLLRMTAVARGRQMMKH